jgi:hypothetical protein
MISSASTLFIATLVFSSAVLGAPIRIPDGSQLMPRAESTTPVIAREIVDVPDNRQRDVIARRSRLVFAREDAPVVVEARDFEEPTIERRYPRRALYERFEKRSPDVTVVGWKRADEERKFARRSLYERFIKREPVPSVEENGNLNINVYDTPEGAAAFENANPNFDASATAVNVPSVATTAIGFSASTTPLVSPVFTPSSSVEPQVIPSNFNNVNVGNNPPLNVPVASVSTFPASGFGGSSFGSSNGVPSFPGSGFQFDPFTGLPINPATGQAFNPASSTGSVVPPTFNAGTSNGAFPGLATDPATGLQLDPFTNLPIDPTTGQAFNPATGLPVNLVSLSGSVVPPTFNTGSTSSFVSPSSVVPPTSSVQQPPAIANQPPAVASSTTVPNAVAPPTASSPVTVDPSTPAASSDPASGTPAVSVDPTTGAPSTSPPVTVDSSTAAAPATPAVAVDPSVTADPAAAAASSAVPATRRSLFGRSVGFSGAAWAGHIRREVY